MTTFEALTECIALLQKRGDMAMGEIVRCDLADDEKRRLLMRVDAFYESVAILRKKRTQFAAAGLPKQPSVLSPEAGTASPAAA